MSECYFRNLSFGVVRLLAIENRFGHCRIVQHEADSALAFLDRARMKRENVDALFGEGLAELAKRSRSVFQTDCELLGGGHGNLFTVYLANGLETSCEIQRRLEAYSNDAGASRLLRDRRSSVVPAHPKKAVMPFSSKAREIPCRSPKLRPPLESTE